MSLDSQAGCWQVFVKLAVAIFMLLEKRLTLRWFQRVIFLGREELHGDHDWNVIAYKPIVM